MMTTTTTNRRLQSEATKLLAMQKVAERERKEEEEEADDHHNCVSIKDSSSSIKMDDSIVDSNKRKSTGTISKVVESRSSTISGDCATTAHNMVACKMWLEEESNSRVNIKEEPSIRLVYNNRNFLIPRISHLRGCALISGIALLVSIILVSLLSAPKLEAATTTSNANANAANADQQQQPLEPILFKHNDLEKQTDYWYKSGRRAIEEALAYQPNYQRAKNAVLFIGDGMSLSTITAARILYGQLMNNSGEEEQLSFEQLNNVALVKTYNIDQQVPDSAATATAILCGIKSNFYTLGVNANVRLEDTNCQRIRQNSVDSIIKQAQQAGKSTGIITNTRITHATPAAAYAHSANRRWECGSIVPRNLEPPCKDIARQLIEDEPGNKLNVILGGGRRCFFGPGIHDPGLGGQAGIRQDGDNLIEKWINQRRQQNDRNFAFVNSTRHLREVDTDKIDYLLGLFSYSHMSYEELRDQSLDGEPSLSEMTELAIKLLSKNPKGFVLMVEGGRIDHAHHENVAGVALRETISLSWAVEAARKLVDTRDTLLAVTSDHAHALTINGIAPRGNPILGLSRFRENSTEQLPYTTLLYGNGPGHHNPRTDPTKGPNSTDSPYHVQYAAIHHDEAYHDGTDVAVFASGPFAHLFQGVQEQSYIAHVFSYALCLGDYSNRQHCFGGAADSPFSSSSASQANRRGQQTIGRPKLGSASADSSSSSSIDGVFKKFTSSSSNANHLNANTTILHLSSLLFCTVMYFFASKLTKCRIIYQH